MVPWVDPADGAAAWEAPLGDPGADPVELLARYVAASTRLHHPRAVAHQVPPPVPVSALADFALGLLNNSVAVYEMSPAATLIERAVVRWMAGALGLGPGADGVVTSGGTLGNLTALLAARQRSAGFDPWEAGLTAGPPLAILMPESAHYSVERAAQVLGLGRAGCVTVPVDAALRMRPEEIGPALDRAEAAGRRPIALVANAGTTAAGTFDPLEEIADVCAARGLWLHVDGAHGAAAALSERHRAKVAGIERADSVVWDAHKMLLVGSLTTGVVFADAADGRAAFAHEAPYLYERAAEVEWYNVSRRSFECTKPAAALRLWLALAVHGAGAFAANVDDAFALATRFAARVADAPDFELPIEPESNIVCFRYAPKGAGDLDALQAAVRRAIVEGGAFHLSQTRLPAGLHLRVTLMNPATTDDDLAALLEAVRDAGRRAGAA